MSRLNYVEEEDFPGQAELWEANQRRSLKGAKGQAALREIEAALLALPEKRLIAERLVDESGAVCAIGALAKHRGQKLEPHKYEPNEYEEEEGFDRETLDVGVALGIPRMVAVKVIDVNDERLRGRYDWSEGRGRFVEFTPEERYQKMLEWVRRQLLPDPPEVKD